ncbi:Thymidylate kinase [Seminavis robusta]|uniref:Thymidylate kinase n=1 Tax=Seminavis robusta TaxID=568900 RepID=A0A9N8HIC6_9STRA|nr:Thymidylate kinase [Seminavis robusta]|eukprot:Sro691_g187800.1 Thymidylate kinase (233) ;mRNA; f:15087-15901
MLVTNPLINNAAAAAVSSTTSLHHNNNNASRGAFIVMEGVDRCGKTTQCGLLLDQLRSDNIPAVAMRFPDRTTAIGAMINQYLTGGTDLDDRAIHLLFTCNGRAIVLGMVQQSDVGLPAPDAVIFLDLSQEEAQQRGGYGEERYETKDLQIRVRQRFQKLQQLDTQVPWHVVSAAQSIEEVQADISKIVEKTMAQAKHKKLGKLWQEGDYVAACMQEKNKNNEEDEDSEKEN